MGGFNLPKMSLTQHHISDDLRESFSSFEHDVVHDDLRGSFSARKQEISQHLSDDLRESFSSAPHDDLRGSFSASADVLSDDFRESLNAARSDDLRGSFATRAPCDDLCESFSASSPIDDLRESLKMEPRHRRLPFGHSTETPESRDWRKGQSVAPPQHARPKQFTAGARRPPRSRDAIARLMAKDLAHVEAGHAKKKREAHERRKKQAAAKKQPKPSPPVPTPAPDPPAAPEHTELFKEIENELWTTPQVFVCIVGHPGVGYRFTPSFADKDKNKDNRGPRCTLEDGTPIQRCAIGTEFVKSKEGVTFLKCSTGRGWLPLHTPNGTQDCFKHLGAEGEVDTSNMRFKRTLEERASGMTGEEVLQVREETKNELWTTPQVFECNTPSPGVGYRHSPDFADKDKNKDNRGPRCTEEDGTPIQRCVIGTEFVKSKEGVTFMKCSSDRGWLPLHTPKGTLILFNHLGAEGQVDTSNMRFKSSANMRQSEDCYTANVHLAV